METRQNLTLMEKTFPQVDLSNAERPTPRVLATNTCTSRTKEAKTKENKKLFFLVPPTSFSQLYLHKYHGFTQADFFSRKSTTSKKQLRNIQSYFIDYCVFSFSYHTPPDPSPRARDPLGWGGGSGSRFSDKPPWRSPCWKRPSSHGGLPESKGPCSLAEKRERYILFALLWMLKRKKTGKSCLVGNKRLYKREGNTYNPICCENLDPKARRFYPPSNISAALRYGRK